MIAFVLVACLLIGATSAQATERNVCTDRRPGFFVRDVRQCNGFFFCHPNGQALYDICPQPFFFNEALQQCVWGKAHCFACPQTPFLSRQAVAGTCDQFVECFNLRPEHRFCPAGLNFNPENSQCDRVECAGPAPVPRVCPPVFDPNNPIFFREENCVDYQYCAGTTLMSGSCPSNLHFNLEKRQCDLPENAGCTNGGGAPGDFTCPPPVAGVLPIYPHPTECTSWYICAEDQTAHLRTCPPGMNFDATLQMCSTTATCATPTGGRRLA